MSKSRIESTCAVFPCGDSTEYEGLNGSEIKAIKELEKVARIWPTSLWLFSGSGTLHVMKKYRGKRACVASSNGEAVHPGFAVTSINIENDGGDEKHECN